MPKVLIIGGGGACGKSEIIRYLCHMDKKYVSYSEIGEKLLVRFKQEYAKKGMNFDSTNVPIEYDKEIIEEEIRRGKSIMEEVDKNKIHLIETGIVGDLAYTLNRNPHLYRGFIVDRGIKEYFKILNPIGILLKTKRNELRKRIMKGKHMNYIPTGMSVNGFIDLQNRLFKFNIKVYEDLRLKKIYRVIQNDGHIETIAKEINSIFDN